MEPEREKKVSTFKEAFALRKEMMTRKREPVLKKNIKDKVHVKEPPHVESDLEEEELPNPFTDSDNSSSEYYLSDNDEDWLPSPSNIPHSSDDEEEDICRNDHQRPRQISQHQQVNDLELQSDIIGTSCVNSKTEFGNDHQRPRQISQHQQANDLELQNQNIGTSCINSDTEFGKTQEYVSDTDSNASSASIQYPALSSSAQEPTMTTLTSSKKKWNKKHSCVYCKEFVIKIARHMERKHSEECEVAQILALPVGSKSRRVAWGKLLKDGDYAHNFETLKEKKGFIIPKYRTKDSDRPTESLLPCPSCKALYTRKYLHQHHQRCKGGGARQRGVSKQGRLLLPPPPNVTESFWKSVVLTMNIDATSKACKNDALIIKYGERSFLKRDVEEHTSGNVSSRMRELGRLLINIREKSSGQVSTLSDALNVMHFDLLLSCVRDLAEFNDETHSFSKGSLALRLGYSVKKCAMIKKMEAKKGGLRKEDKEAEDFLQVFNGDWSDSISSAANQSLGRLQFNKPLMLPACEDVHKLYAFVKDHKTSDYAELAQVALCEITLFNRKRGGEVQRMTVNDLKTGLKIDQPMADVQESLTEVERKLATRLKRVEIRGKFNRKVAVLLTDSMMTKLDKILELREKLNISNRYIFTRRNGDKPYRGHDVIKKLAREAKVKDLKLFTWTSLRKQIATMSQAMVISENDQDMLAAFLGHDIRVHREYYRLPSEILQKSKVANILMQMNGDEQSTVDEDSDDEHDELAEDAEDMNIIRKKADSAISNGETCTNMKSGEIPAGNDTLLGKRKRGATKTRIATAVENCHTKCKMVKQKGAVEENPKGVKKAWSREEREAVLRNFDHFIRMGKAPSKFDVEKVMEMEDGLKSRSWTNIKDFVYNSIRKLKSSKL